MKLSLFSSSSKKDKQRKCPLVLDGNTYIRTTATSKLLQAVGGGVVILQMTDQFYTYFFEDKHLQQFVMDPEEPHASRLAAWIVEKMGGLGNIWTNSRPRNARVKAHVRAWHSDKREDEDVGRRFTLTDCRIWMRLMFWAARSTTLIENKVFMDWYVEFISHFIAVYEFSAPPYTQESLEWSKNPENIRNYIANGRVMTFE